MKTMGTILYIIFLTVPYIAITFLVNTIFDKTDYPLWVTLGILWFGLLNLFIAILIPYRKDKSE